MLPKLAPKINLLFCTNVCFIILFFKVNIIAKSVTYMRPQWYSDNPKIYFVGRHRPPEELLESRAQNVEGVTVVLYPPDLRRKLQSGRIICDQSVI